MVIPRGSRVLVLDQRYTHSDGSFSKRKSGEIAHHYIPSDTWKSLLIDEMLGANFIGSFSTLRGQQLQGADPVAFFEYVRQAKMKMKDRMLPPALLLNSRQARIQMNLPFRWRTGGSLASPRTSCCQGKMSRARKMPSWTAAANGFVIDSLLQEVCFLRYP